MLYQRVRPHRPNNLPTVVRGSMTLTLTMALVVGRVHLFTRIVLLQRAVPR